MTEPDRVWITVHDARLGRDARLVGPDDIGEKLMTFAAERPYFVGDLIWLPDGSQVKVIGRDTTFSDQGVVWIVYAGDVDAEADPEDPTSLPPGWE